MPAYNFEDDEVQPEGVEPPKDEGEEEEMWAPLKKPE